MHPDRPALESVASSLDDLTKRLSEIADRHDGGADDSLATELYEVERALNSAVRRLDQVVRRI